MHRAHLVLWGASHDPTSPTNPQCVLLGMPTPGNLPGIASANLRAGHPVLYVVTDSDRVLALYAVAHNGVPQQIWGKRDVLLDGFAVYDHTLPYLPTLRMVQKLLLAAYGAMSINELVGNQAALRQMEEGCFRHCLKDALGWNECKDAVISLWENYSWGENPPAHVLRAIHRAACPRKAALNEPVRLDFGSYPMNSGA